MNARLERLKVLDADLQEILNVGVSKVDQGYPIYSLVLCSARDFFAI
jgi:hypothetical protein